MVENLDKSGDLNDFMSLIEVLASGELPPNNIVFQLMLEMARFQKCRNTCGMRYREVTKNFWTIVCRLCRGVAFNFFSGEKNWGQVDV